MNKKCIGCGAVLQFNDKAKEGFIDEKFYEEATYCERCFRIKNYGDYKSVIKDNETFIKIIKNINPTDLVILVADLFNLPENFDLIKENIKNPTVLVLTKRDILPKIVYEEKLLNYIDNYDIEFLDKIIVSSNKNYHFDNLLGMIRKHRTSNNIYVVGFTNAGKSTRSEERRVGKEC